MNFTLKRYRAALLASTALVSCTVQMPKQEAFDFLKPQAIVPGVSW